MREKMQVRLLDAGDAALILQSPAFDAPAGKSRTAAFLADQNHLIAGAVRDGVLIGFASGAILLHPDKPPFLFINEVGVEDAFRRRGIGRRLCDVLMTAARLRGCRGTWLATETDNEAARALYRSLDGRETEGIVVYDWDGAMDPPAEG